jgi:type II secretory pathway pseudopilin PulG
MRFSSKNTGALFVSGRMFLNDSRLAIRNRREKAFSLAETVAALVILAFMSTSVLVVINNYMASAADSVMHMQAFEVVRNNMEKLVASSSLEESVEYGTSEIYPDIRWETSVEMFYEPLNAKMWIQAICSAEYTDSEGEVQTIELTHWLTDLTKAQSLQILAQQEREREKLAGEIIETLEEAAIYAGVDEQTIQQWVKNGMKLTEEGYYIMSQLDLYRDTNGRPTIQDKKDYEEDKYGGSLPVDESSSGSGDDMPFSNEPF